MAAWAVLYIKAINNGSVNLHFGTSFKKAAADNTKFSLLADKELLTIITQGL